MRSSRPRLRTGMAVAATLSMVTGALALGVQAAGADTGPTGRAMLHGTKPMWATAKADKGSTAASNKVSARVYLAGRDAAGLAAYAKEVSDPSSANYGKYLTAKQVKARFGATPQQISEVTAWLTSAGLKVTGTSSHYVSVSGDAQAVEKAFSTKLHNYTKSGKTYHAPDTTASVPASLKGAVLTVTGLDNAPKAAQHDDALPPPDAAFLNAGPLSAYYGQKVDKKLPNAYGSKAPYTIKGYTGKQLRAAYGAGKYTGKGVTVAITDAYASPTIAKDASTYAKRNGDKKYKAGQFSQVVPNDFTIDDTNCPDPAGWYGEESLDVESVHAVAPDADITYVGAKSCMDDDLLDSLSKVVDNHLADIVSNSWGDIEADQTPASQAAYDQVFQQGAVEGIGFYFSTGDDGDFKAATGTKQVDTPANSSWVTAVGGTSLAVGKKNNYEWETGWGTLQSSLSANGKTWAGFPGAFTSGAGGGTSTTVAQPYYQKGVVPGSLSKANGTTDPMRTLPDISAVADPNTGFLIGMTQTQANGKQAYSEYRLGGTSLASPVIAGIQALAQQARHGVPIGFANPGIYQRYGTPAFHDVTDHPLGAGQGIAVVRNDYTDTQDPTSPVKTTIRTLGHDSSLSATVGYDDVTGVGTPAGDYVSSYKTR
ncbi:S53 family peptidase [Streptomyces sp. 8L]|uniref:S53 family peptidase n=1 Tax=Streptomyces sp. 8L TaxID=2877242 RepID=UPI001CD5F692|nr:S53 family peptidase [Streptomyces sp. 8L]MCA1217442.1 S53 family peptidase [Streptomyces sp. 8L]